MQQDRSEYIGQIRSWHSSMQNISTINRFEHIEPKEPGGSITSSQDRAFGVFVRVPCSEETVLSETHPEQ